MDAAAQRRWVVVLGTIVAIGPMTIDMYLPSLPALQAHFGVDAGKIQLTLSAFFLGLALGQLAYGPIADRYGRRGPLLVGLALYVAASFACAFAPTIEVLIGARFVQAVGGCSGMVISRAMVRDRFEPYDMARIVSSMVLVMGVAPILAPLAGGQILVFAGWQAIFYVLTVFGLVCFAAAYAGLPETLAEPGAPIRIGAVLRGYAGLLVHRHFMGYALAGGIGTAGMFAYISGSAFVFIDVFGVAPDRFGLFFGANAAGLIAASQLNRWLLRRHRPERIVRGALTVFSSFGVLLVLTSMTGWGGLWGFAVPLFFCIGSLGFSFPNATAVAMAPFGSQAGLASALMGTVQFSVAAVAGAAVGQLHDGTPVPMALVIAACGLTAVTLLRVLVRVPE